MKQIRYIIAIALFGLSVSACQDENRIMPEPVQKNYFDIKMRPETDITKSIADVTSDDIYAYTYGSEAADAEPAIKQTSIADGYYFYSIPEGTSDIIFSNKNTDEDFEIRKDENGGLVVARLKDDSMYDTDIIAGRASTADMNADGELSAHLNRLNSFVTVDLNMKPANSEDLLDLSEYMEYAYVRFPNQTQSVTYNADGTISISESTEPAEPQEPVIPDDPEDPDTPDNPDNPDTPVNPDDPNTPQEPILGENLLYNGDIEIKENDFAVGWDRDNGAEYISLSSDEVHGGAYSIKAANTSNVWWGNNDAHKIRFRTSYIDVTPGKTYRVGFWAKAADGGEAIRLRPSYLMINRWNYDFEYNTYFYNDSWDQIDNPAVEQVEQTYTINIPYSTGSQKWMGQMIFSNTGIEIKEAHDYLITLRLKSDYDHPRVTVKISDSANDDNFCIDEEITLVAGEDYDLIADFTSTVNITDLKLTLDFGGATGGSQVEVSDIFIADHTNGDEVYAYNGISEDWTYRRFDVTIPEHFEDLGMYFECAYSIGTFYIDDVTICEITGYTDGDDNGSDDNQDGEDDETSYINPASLIINGDFESNELGGSMPDYWSTWEGLPSIDTVVTHSGSHAIRLGGNGQSGWLGISAETVTVEQGRKYCFGAWVKTNADGQQFWFNTNSSQYQSVNLTAGEWTYVSTEYTASSTADLTLQLDAYVSVDAEVYIDDVEFYPLEETEENTSVMWVYLPVSYGFTELYCWGEDGTAHSGSWPGTTCLGYVEMDGVNYYAWEIALSPGYAGTNAQFVFSYDNAGTRVQTVESESCVLNNAMMFDITYDAWGEPVATLVASSGITEFSAKRSLSNSTVTDGQTTYSICTGMATLPTAAGRNSVIELVIGNKTGNESVHTKELSYPFDPNKHYRLTLSMRRNETGFGFEIEDIIEESFDIDLN